MSYLSTQTQREDDDIMLGYSASICNGRDEFPSIFQHSRTDVQSEKHMENSRQSNIFCHSMLSYDIAPSACSISSNASCKAIVLANWYIQPMVGLHAVRVCGEIVGDGKQRKSGAITMRIHSRCVLTSRRSLYSLVGPIDCTQRLPKWFEEVFCNGFPSNWKTHVNKYLNELVSESSDENCDVEELAKCYNDKGPKSSAGFLVKLDLHQWAIKILGNHITVEGFAKNKNGTLQLYQTGLVDAVNNRTLIHTVSGSWYRIIGPMSTEATVQRSIPLWFARKFYHGFPNNWKELLNNYMKHVLTKEGSFQSAKSSKGVPPSIFSDYLGEGHCPNTPNDNASFNDSDRETNLSHLSSVVNVPSTLVKRQPQKTKSKLQKAQRKIVCGVNEKILMTTVQHNADKTLASKEHVLTSAHSSCNKTPTNIPDRQHKRTRKKRKLSSVSLTLSCMKKRKKSEHKPPKSDLNMKTPSANSLNMPKFLSTSERGLYRTRSGRHVFPPLQNWTYQRLTPVEDENGNEMIVFVPGTQSVLDSISPAADALRTADWVHRQFKQDQLMSLPSPNSSTHHKVLVQKRANKSKSNCVKKLLNMTPTKNLSRQKTSTELLNKSEQSNGSTLGVQILHAPSNKSPKCNADAILFSPKGCDNSCRMSLDPSGNEDHVFSCVDKTVVVDHLNKPLSSSLDELSCKRKGTLKSILLKKQDLQNLNSQINSRKNSVAVSDALKPGQAVCTTPNAKMSNNFNNIKESRMRNNASVAKKRGRTTKICDGSVPVQVKDGVKCTERNSEILMPTQQEIELSEITNKKLVAMPMPSKRYNLRLRKVVPKIIEEKKKELPNQKKSLCKKKLPLPVEDVALTHELKGIKPVRELCNRKSRDGISCRTIMPTKFMTTKETRSQRAKCNTNAKKLNSVRTVAFSGKDATTLAMKASTNIKEQNLQKPFDAVANCSRSPLVVLERVKNHPKDPPPSPVLMASSRRKGKAKPSLSEAKKGHSKRDQNPNDVVGAKAKSSQRRPKVIKSKNKKKKLKENQTHNKGDIKIKLPKSTAIPQKENTLQITARRGTLKLKRQIRAALTSINQAKNEQDCFAADKATSNKKQSIFDEEFFTLDLHKDAVTPCTPVSKLPSGFDEYIATPAWFKTPKSADGFSVNDFKTPTTLGPLDQAKEPSTYTTQEAHKTVVHIQRKKIRKKKLSITQTTQYKKMNFKDKTTPFTSAVFNVEEEKDSYSDEEDDVYFSD